MKKVCILRLGHRPFRDKRVTTHVGLAARAFGADGMYLAARDPGLAESIRDVVARWGGEFFIEDGVSWKACVRAWKEQGGTVVHLTMYGLPMTEVIGEIRGKEKLLIVIGAEKVPGGIYGLADYNVSVTTQPHSEVSATAVFLDHLFEGAELNRSYPDAVLRIYPSRDGKRTGS
ncbi:MAG TPA: tRNA (cytidine(56)-2'-O)-methyltransferase [Methanomicrobiales archaeon]|jgi:tRNA (cytidine56-2'-O)-methyltransferase|nr:tRNA (cytidine(56)-2'-O)-methyltransferase [Methanomicrobiales archaeon]